jgi:hypothetical protein
VGRPRLHRRLSPAAAALIALAGAGLVSGGAPTAAEARPAFCPPQPKTLSPKGRVAARFTMLIRVNQVANARTYANPDPASGGLGGRIRSNDVFVVNTRFWKSSPEDWREIVSVLSTAFPCNRIVSLNGLGADPSAPGYAYALNGSPGVWGSLTDWEPNDWNLARLTNPHFAPWTGRFGKTRKRVRRWIGGLTYGFALSNSTRGRRVGLVPQHRRKWDYGRLGREVSAQNRRLGKARRGVLSVQTQDACADGGGRGMKKIVGGLRRQYKLANYKRIRIKRQWSSRGKRFRHRKRKWRILPRNLGVQVSFSATPSPGSGMALLRTSPLTASHCTLTTLRRGAGAILYWASPDSMRGFFSIPRICELRLPPSGPC